MRISKLPLLLAVALWACGGEDESQLLVDARVSDQVSGQPQQNMDVVVVAPDFGINTNPNPDPNPDANSNPGPNPTPDAGANPDPGPDAGPTPSQEGVRFVRIHTSASPSWVAWKEIEVQGASVAQPGLNVNLALNKEITATKFSAETPPERAVDGDLDTDWNAGDFAPVTVTIDLGEPTTIDTVRLLVAQFPEGATTHVVSFGDAEGAYTQAHLFQQNTENGQWLEFYAEEAPNPGPGSDPPSVTNLPRGLAWVRNNPMFISGLSASIGQPTAAQVNEYYDQFHATAAHMWTDGLTDQLQGWQSANHPQGRWMGWVENDGKSFNHQVAGGLGANPPGRIGYQVGDEPGLNGDGMTELKEIEAGMDALRAVDPDALLVLNFSFWAEDFAGLLEYYGEHVDGDVFSYDRYSPGYKEHETLAQVRDAALKWNRPYWRYLRSYHDVGTGNPTHETDYRWDAFVGLVYGYTGHTWFLYQSSPGHIVASDLYAAQGGVAEQKLPPWNIVAQLNVEMRHLGRAITQLTSTDVRYVAGQSLYLPDGLEAWSAGAGGDPYISKIEAKENSLFSVRDLAVGYFADDEGEVYVMIQNQQHKGAQFPIGNTKDSTVEVTFDFSGAPANLDSSKVVMLDHKTGNQVDLTLEPAGDGKQKLVRLLKAAEVVFFKYATGKPFPLGP